jgi:hypothetical protein
MCDDEYLLTRIAIAHREAFISNPNRWARNSLRSKAVRGVWTTPSIDELRQEVPMPDLSQPLKYSETNNSRQSTGNTEGSFGSQSPSENLLASGGAAKYFRNAFRALVRPIRIKGDPERNMPSDIEQILASDDAFTPLRREYYAVDSDSSQTYHSYLGSLRQQSSDSPAVSELDGTSRARLLNPPGVIYELDGTPYSVGRQSPAELASHTETVSVPRSVPDTAQD